MSEEKQSFMDCVISLMVRGEALEKSMLELRDIAIKLDMGELAQELFCTAQKIRDLIPHDIPD